VRGDAAKRVADAGSRVGDDGWVHEEGVEKLAQLSAADPAVPNRHDPVALEPFRKEGDAGRVHINLRDRAQPRVRVIGEDAAALLRDIAEFIRAG
jgi:hypothetical protein